MRRNTFSMYPSLHEAFLDLFGIDWSFLKLFQSFGTFVALSFLLCAWAFAKELRRKDELGLFHVSYRTITKGLPATSGELIGQFIFGFALGFKLLGAAFSGGKFGADPRAYILSGEGSILAGLVVGAGLAYWRYYEAKKAQLPQPKEEQEKISAADHVGNMTLIAALFGFIGAKMFHLLENFGTFLENPSDMIFSTGGFTMYGGLILGGIAVLLYARSKKLNLLHVMDACAPGLFLAYGVGRLGCQISGDGDWGIVNTAAKPGWMGFLPDWFWSYTYPNNVNHVCNPYQPSDPEYMANIFCDFKTNPALVAPVFPTPLYEAVICIALFFVFWYFRKRILIPGLLFSAYLMLNGTERFFIELIRVNEVLFHLGSWGVTQAEVIAFVLFCMGGFGIWWTRRHAAKNKAAQTS